ncbi:MAG: hypothetical protein M5U32_04370 [Myxococcota bacterium]|nr:hypothetical protein [Myxococcota bacterium]
MPGLEWPSWALALESDTFGANELATRLRRAPIPVIARVAGGLVLLDARTLCEQDLEDVVASLAAALIDGAAPAHAGASD